MKKKKCCQYGPWNDSYVLLGMIAWGLYYKTFYFRNCCRIVTTSTFNLGKARKRSSLLQYSNNYARKKFYSTGALGFLIQLLQQIKNFQFLN